MVSGRKPNIERRRQVTELRARGWSLAKIGAQLGISRQAVHVTLRSIHNPAKRLVTCRQCKMPIDPVGVSPREASNTLCLICVSKGPRASFGQRLKAFRLAVGMTRKELSAGAGLSESMIRYYEGDWGTPTAEGAIRLAKALGLTLEVLGGDKFVPGKRGRPRKTSKAVAKRGNTT
jgi:transcriptional regulator with XRE-family HTH domain